MMTPEECATMWKAIVNTFEETRDQGPAYTVKILLERWELPKVKETFAVVAKIKKHDGRIYGRNREEMNRTQTNPIADTWDRENPMIRAGLDKIHTTHINQMITELLKAEREVA